MNNVFRAGVEPGGLTMDFEIKIMICYILQQTGQPMPISALIEVFVEEGIGNYFEVASAASALVKSGHVNIGSENGEKCYYNTSLGDDAAQTFEKKLPATVREKAVQAANDYFLIQKRRAKNETHIEKVDDGFLLTLKIQDIGSDLLSVTILLPDMESCKQIEKRFMKDAVVVYKGVVALLTGSFHNMGGLIDT